MTAGAVLLIAGTPAGGYYYLVCVLLLADFANSVIDVLVEPSSRAPLGGLPPREYLVHVVGSTLAGALSAAFILLGRPLAGLPTALMPHALPAWLAASSAALVASG